MQKIFKIEDAEAIDYCTRPENDFFDRKSSRIRPADLQDIAVAFANADGGTVVVGVEDEATSLKPLDRWKGLPDIEKYNDCLSSLSTLNPGIDFSHKFLFRAGTYQNNYVLVIEVRKSLRLHETAKREVLVRKGAQSIRVKGTRIHDLMRAKGLVSEEDRKLTEVRAEPIVDGPQLKAYLEALPITDKDPLGFALQEGIVNDKSMDPTVAGVILFADNPSSLMPRQCAVKIVRYDSSDEEIERDRLTNDVHSIEAPLRDQIERSFTILKDVVKRCKFWSLDGLQAAPYPDEAIYELLVNSVLHRDYGVSDNVLISVYRNRIEFKSPGRLPGFVTPANILQARYSRNPKLVRLLSRYPNSPNKDLGEGVNTVFERMKQAGYVDPEIKDDEVTVSVTLRRAPRTDAEGMVSSFIRKFGSISNRQALDLLALDTPEQVTALFARMKGQGRIIREDERQTGVQVRWTIQA